MRKIAGMYLRMFVIVMLIGGLSLLCAGRDLPEKHQGKKPGVVQLLGPNDGAGGQGPE